MDRRHGKGHLRPSSPVNFWTGLTDITPPQPVQRPPPPVARLPPPTDVASVTTGSSNGSSTIKASRAHFGLFGFVARSKDKAGSEGGSTITPKGPHHGRSPFDLLTSRGKGKATADPAPPHDPNALSEAAEYLESKRAAVMLPRTEPLHVTSSRALEDLMSPLNLRRSREEPPAFLGGSTGSEKSVKSEDDDLFMKELEAGATPSDVPVWLSGSLGSNTSASMPPPHRDRRSRRGSTEIRRSESNGSLGSAYGDDESYSNDDGSSEDDIRRQSGEGRRHSNSNFPPAHRGSPTQRYGPRIPPGMHVTRENFRPPVPAPTGMPPDPFGIPDPFGSDSNANHFDAFASPVLFQMDSLSPVDPMPKSGVHPMIPNYLNHYAPLDTIHSDSEYDGTPGAARSSRPAQYPKTSLPPHLPSDRRTKIEKERTSAGFSRRPPGGKR